MKAVSSASFATADDLAIGERRHRRDARGQHDERASSSDATAKVTKYTSRRVSIAGSIVPAATAAMASTPNGVSVDDEARHADDGVVERPAAESAPVPLSSTADQRDADAPS